MKTDWTNLTQKPMTGEILITWSDCYKEITIQTAGNATRITAPKAIGRDYLVGYFPEALLRYGIENDCLSRK